MTATLQKRNSLRYAARQPPRLSMWTPLAVATLLLGSAATGDSSWQQSARCPEERLRTADPRSLEWTACPAGCKCSSLDTQLQCHSADLPQLDDADAVRLETMVVEGVSIPRLEGYNFTGLNHLLALTLSNGRISEVAEDAFLDLSFLRHLDLSNNEIVEIPVNTFIHNKNLRFLVLDGNPLYVPSSDPLLRSTSLGSLSIRACGITSVNSQTFAGLPDLYIILMEDNPLRGFPDEAISRLQKLCSIGVNILIDGESGDSNTGEVAKSFTGFDWTQILLISGLVLILAVMLIGVYKACTTRACPCRRKQEVVLRESHLSRSNQTNSSGWTEAPTSMYEVIGDRQIIDRGNGYRIVSQRELLPPAYGYPGYVYNGVDLSGSSSGDRYSYVANAGLYPPATNNRRPTDALPPPPPYENTGRVRLPSRQESVATSTSDLRSSVISDLNA